MSKVPPITAQVPFADKPGKQTTTSGKAIWSLVLGISSFFCLLFTGLAAVILGILALGDIGKSYGRLTGNGLAIGGIITGALGCFWTLPVLIALLLPAVQAAREAAREQVSMNNMSQMAIAMLNHEAVSKRMPAAMPDPTPVQPGETGPNLSWRVQILPYLDQQQLYDQFKQDEPWDGPNNSKLIDQMPEFFASLSHPLAPGKTMYRVPYTDRSDPAKIPTRAMFLSGPRGPILAELADGTSNTIMIIEVDPDAAVIWTKPDEWEFDPDNPMRSLGKARHGRFLATMADGATKKIDANTPKAQIRSMFTARAGD